MLERKKRPKNEKVVKLIKNAINPLGVLTASWYCNSSP
jgi:hypothetical protein